ncbi:hypothetical protein JAAARDRAFT_189545 [Jaapia argillacea MUCL 33604]|uniref:Uncharacterized protein n=1 Tax=Jaapia argillacea MUCL 33604 TaxID=933084 RepID=A0A067QFA0_9AGAM|nr:hypothetical protein JAAARDRAFT_189545 [Jaapia argillacea MUCL 33604]
MKIPTSSANNVQSDSLIAIMGSKGAGKSSFIDVAMKHLGHIDTLKAVALIESPGCNDCSATRDASHWDAEISKMVLQLMDCSLSGIIYLHDISHPKIPTPSPKILAAFRKLCASGVPWATNVVVVTTFWDRLPAGEFNKGLAKEAELKNEDGFLHELFVNGARFLRHAHQSDRLPIENTLFSSPPSIVLELLASPPASSSSAKDPQGIERIYVSEATFAAELERLKTQHTLDLQQLKEEMTTLRETLRVDRDNAQAEGFQKLKEETATHRETLRVEREEARAQDSQTLKDEMVTIQEKLRAEMDEAKAQHMQALKEEMATVREKLRNETDEAKTQRMQALKEEMSTVREKLRDDMDEGKAQDMQALKEEMATVLEKLRDEIKAANAQDMQVLKEEIAALRETPTAERDEAQAEPRAFKKLHAKKNPHVSLKATVKSSPSPTSVSENHAPPSPRVPFAVVSWGDRHSRVYFQDEEGWIREAWCEDGEWSTEDAGYVREKCEERIFCETIVKLNTPLAAVSWDNGNEIRVYYLSITNTLREYRWSSKSGSTWSRSCLDSVGVRVEADSGIAAIHSPHDNKIHLYCQLGTYHPTPANVHT